MPAHTDRSISIATTGDRLAYYGSYRRLFGDEHRHRICDTGWFAAIAAPIGPGPNAWRPSLLARRLTPLSRPWTNCCRRCADEPVAYPPGAQRRDGRAEKSLCAISPNVAQQGLLYGVSRWTASAFIGSHNMTSFALTGLNGEAAVMLEGPAELAGIRQGPRTRRGRPATRPLPYSSGLKEAYAWWAREFLEGLRIEVHLPQDWTIIRTILLFASAARSDRPKAGDHIYFEIPAWDRTDRIP